MRAPALFAVLVLCVSSVARAQDDPLAAVRDADPLVLARVAGRLGDAAVLARLDDARPRDVRLAAVRATPFLHAPERALAPLARIAKGRDPLVAPAAALAAVRIARALDAASLDARETERSELGPARRALAELASDETARADVRRAASIAAALLVSLRAP